jgi:hypothetical protein
LLAIALAPSSAGIARSNFLDLGCQVASDYATTLLHQLRGTVAFNREMGQERSSLNSKGWFAENGDKAASPAYALLKAANRQRGIDALSTCPDLPTNLQKAHFDRKVTVSEAGFLVSGDETPTEISISVGIYFPVISKDGNHALMFSSQVSGKMGGGLYAYYMSKDSHGRWIITSLKMMNVA